MASVRFSTISNPDDTSIKINDKFVQQIDDTNETGMISLPYHRFAFHSGSSSGVSTGLITPSVAGFAPTDRGSFYTLGQYAFMRSSVNLYDGTYTVRVFFGRYTDRSIVHVYIDGTSVGTVDTYGTSAPTVTDITSVSVSGSGLHTLELRSDSKNASSTNYYTVVHSVGFVRTA